MLDPMLYPMHRGTEVPNNDPVEKLLRELQSLRLQEVRSAGAAEATEVVATWEALRASRAEKTMEWQDVIRYVYGVHRQKEAQEAIDGTVARTSAGFAASRMRQDPGQFAELEGGWFRPRDRAARRFALESAARLAELLEERGKIDSKMEGMRIRYEHADRLLAFALTPEGRRDRMLKLGVMMRALGRPEREMVQHSVELTEWAVITRGWLMAEEQAARNPTARSRAPEGENKGDDGWLAAVRANREAEEALRKAAQVVAAD